MSGLLFAKLKLARPKKPSMPCEQSFLCKRLHLAVLDLLLLKGIRKNTVNSRGNNWS